MKQNKLYILVLGSMVFLTTIVGIVGNIAVTEIPETVRPYLWVAWPILVILVLATIALTVFQLRLENKFSISEAQPLNRSAPDSSIAKGNEMTYDYEYDVFISYSSADSLWVEKELIPRLRTVDAKIYDLRDFHGFDKGQAIENATKMCRRALLVISKSYFEDEWEQYKNLLFLAMDPASIERRVIPIIIEDCEIPLRLSHIIPIDLTIPNDQDNVWSRLLSTLKQKPIDQLLVGSGLLQTKTSPQVEVSDPPTKSQINNIINQLRMKVEDETAYPEAVEFAQEYRPYVLKLGNVPMMGLFFTWYGHALMYIGATENAIKVFADEVIVDLEQMHFEDSDDDFEYWCEALGRSHNNIGYINWIDLGRLDVAIKETFKALNYFLKLPDVFVDQIATAYDNIGRIYSQLGYSFHAELLVEHGRQLRKENDSKRISLSIDSLANVYLNSGQPNRALAFCDEAFRQFLSYYKNTGKGERRVGLALLTKGRALRRLASLDYTLDISKSLNFVDNFAQLDKSEDALLAARDRFISSDEKIRLFYVENELACTYRERARLYREMGRNDECRNTIQLANEHIQSSLEYLEGEGIVNAWKYKLHYLDACEDMARAWLMQGNNKKAMEWINKAIEQIPEDYLIDNQPQFSLEDVYQQIGKIFILKGDLSTRKQDWVSSLKNYVLATAYFSLFRNPDPENVDGLFPTRIPELVNQQLLKIKIYNTLAMLSTNELQELRENYSKVVDQDLRQELIEGFIEILNLLCKVRISVL